MTNVIIIGEQPEKKEVKPIEFVKALECNEAFTTACHLPKHWENIELICKNYSTQYDLMFAYNNIRHEGCLYLGHFNDGIV